MDETRSAIKDSQDMINDVQEAGDEPINTQIKAVQFPQLNKNPQLEGGNRNMDLILDISVPVSVELGCANMLVKDILNLTHGSVVELDKLAGSLVDLMVRGKLLAQGEVVVVEENFGIKITNICSSEERVKSLA